MGSVSVEYCSAGGAHEKSYSCCVCTGLKVLLSSCAKDKAEPGGRETGVRVPDSPPGYPFRVPDSLPGYRVPDSLPGYPAGSVSDAVFVTARACASYVYVSSDVCVPDVDVLSCAACAGVLFGALTILTALGAGEK